MADESCKKHWLRIVLAACALGLLPACATAPFANGQSNALSTESARAARNTDASAHEALSPALAKSLAKRGKIYVTYGQSNATNAGDPGPQPQGPVFMVFEGKAYGYRDPTLGGTGPGGSVWGKLGALQLAQGDAAVFFSMAGYGGATMQELATPPHLDYFLAELRATQAALGPIDAVLIHQGESNHRALRGAWNYRASFDTLLAEIRAITDAPVYLSLVSICGNDSDTRLLALQEEIIRETPGVLRGPNTDLLAAPELRRPDGCHFSQAGLEAFAKAWQEALEAAAEQ